jgi:hypothetical protein
MSDCIEAICRFFGFRPGGPEGRGKGLLLALLLSATSQGDVL